MRSFPFLYYDDEQYVTKNPAVQAGLTRESVAWAFTTTHASNWHPLTWLSHMADVTLFGPGAAGPHVENALFHALNACLVFLWLANLTGSAGRSAAVAALFALHPQRVESVAWIAERKDLLCACFTLVSLIAWTRFTRGGSRSAYAFALAAMGLAALAKPMVVSLPLLLLVLDFWPLARGLRLVEKLPFAAVALASSLVTLGAQTHAIDPGIAFPARVANALVTLARQLGFALWPADLAVLYPHPGTWPIAVVLIAGVVVAALAALAFASRRRAPYVTAGLLWYAVALGPTLGLVQVGYQATADRYTYLPQIGGWLAIVWAAASATLPRAVVATALAAVLLAFAAQSRAQLAYWRDDLTLWQRALAVTGDNAYAQTEAGIELAARGRNDEALPLLEAAIRLQPSYERAQANLGFVLLRLGRAPESVTALSRALALDPTTGGAGERHFYLALALEQSGRTQEAIAEYELHQSLLPTDPRAAEAIARLRATTL